MKALISPTKLIFKISEEIKENQNDFVLKNGEKIQKYILKIIQINDKKLPIDYEDMKYYYENNNFVKNMKFEKLKELEKQIPFPYKEVEDLLVEILGKDEEYEKIENLKKYKL
jgi:hypothetical protein